MIADSTPVQPAQISGEATARVAVHVAELRKHYGDVAAVDDVELTVRAGEFFTLLGPSGSGKTSLLRLIAGFERPDVGRIELAGRDVTRVPPYARNVNTVFQDYALFPHMSVADNIEYGLRVRHVDKAARRARTAQALETVRLAGLGERKPAQLSGGQRQRVAIGRAIVRNPRVFLFDEPLSNLDAQLRDEMRGEIKRLHQEISTTMIYVTHDQVEAMTLADRIVLLRDGVIEQQGSPLDLFEQPASLFVAGFLGSPRMNFIRGRLERTADAAFVKLGDGGPSLALPSGRARDVRDGVEVILGFRPEHVGRSTASPPSDGYARIESAIELVQPTGSRSYATFSLAGQPAMAELQSHDAGRTGEPIHLDINLRSAVLFDPGTGKAFQGSRQ
jgi:multiple sugar transport system ATP-binding protein